MINRTNSVLAGLLACVLLLTSISRVDLSSPNFEVLPDMKYTPAWPAFSRNPNFANGRTMQAPVPGTIARGAMPLHYTASKEDALRAGEELRNPIAAGQAEVGPAASEPPGAKADGAEKENTEETGTAKESTEPDGAETEEAKRRAAVELRRAASIARGGDTYRVFCVACHGPKGLGDGLVTQRGFPPPPSLLTGKSLQMKDGQLFHILSYGQGSMASFAAQLSHQQRWEVITFVRDLQGRADANQSSEAAPEPADGTPNDEASTTGATPNDAATDNATNNDASAKDDP